MKKGPASMAEESKLMLIESPRVVVVGEPPS